MNAKAKDIILRGFSQQGHSCQEMFFGFTNPESHMVTLLLRVWLGHKFDVHQSAPIQVM